MKVVVVVFRGKDETLDIENLYAMLFRGAGFDPHRLHEIYFAHFTRICRKAPVAQSTDG
jgi:hypothetical protein